ncbi:hypothetical protein AB0M02_37700 [Actinoplanes sp. NPDC051861]|uniref:hypothetical protein n=1 Tax=Actinoplanes sp. NPDC051861 TaxID=3155170 RepID=UPI003445F5BF
MVQLIVFVGVLPFWWLVARPGRDRWAGLGVLGGWAAGSAVLAAAYPRVSWELAFAALPVSVLIVARLRDPERPRSWPFRVLVVLTVVLGLVSVPLLLSEQNPAEPPAGVVLPLPEGLVATEGYGGGDCGTDVCSTFVAVGGRPGQTPDDLLAETRRHLSGRGFAEECRRTGLLLDRRELCALATMHEDQVLIRLQSVRGEGF